MQEWALRFVQSFEGLHDGDKSTPLLEPERDPIGIYTLGWGAIFDLSGARVTKDTPAITRAQADALLVRDFGRAITAAITLCQPRKLSEAQTIAVADFVYNLGAGAFRGSTLRKHIQAGRNDVSDQFMRWRFAAGRELPGLVRRRGAEAALFNKG